MATPDPDLKLVTVLETDNFVLLDLAQAALDDGGIEFALSAPSSPEFGFTPILNPVSRIMVAEPDAARAQEALQSLPDASLPDPSLPGPEEIRTEAEEIP